MFKTITFEDDFTINELLSYKNLFMDNFLKYEELTIDLTNVKKIDTAAIQMLIAAKKECIKLNKRLSLITSEEVNKVLILAGIQL